MATLQARTPATLVRPTVAIGGLIAAAVGAILLIPGVTDPDKVLAADITEPDEAGTPQEPVSEPFLPAQPATS